MKKPLFNQVTIVGLGLIGGSLGMDLKLRRLARSVTGLSRSMRTVHKAVERGAIDTGTTIPRRAVEQADIVVIATPVDTIVSIAGKVAPFMPRGSVLTDVGSTKAAVVEAMEQTVPAAVHFVGAHPIAGSDRAGIQSARAGLFDGTAGVLTPTPRTSKRALERVRRLWEGVGQRVVTMSPAQHDRALALSSHLPHLISACLAQAADANALPCAPKSLMEMTRLANGDPDLWDDILLSNQDAVLKAMQRFEREWRKLYAAIEGGQRGAVKRTLARGQRKRQLFLRQNKS